MNVAKRKAMASNIWLINRRKHSSTKVRVVVVTEKQWQMQYCVDFVDSGCMEDTQKLK